MDVHSAGCSSDLWTSARNVGGYAEVKANASIELNNPTGSGWDCVWFGSYPQSEVTAENAADEYQALEDAPDSQWNDNEIAIGGVKYRRMKKEHATDVQETDDGLKFYQWEDDASWHYFRYEPIQWRVLQVEDEKIFLRANICLDDQKYHETDTPATWDKSSIRSWLNSDFMNSAFSVSEIQAIADTHVKNDPNPTSGKPGGEDTTDKIFLLSEAEVKNYSYGFRDKKDAEFSISSRNPSDYAQAMGLGVLETNMGAVYYYSGNVAWLLRSPGEYLEYNGSACVNETCDIVMSDLAGICPALWLSRSSEDYFSAGAVSIPGEIERWQPCPDRPVYTVTFASDGGSAVSSQIVRTGSAIQEPEPPERDGYTFLGWYQGEEKWDFTKGMPEGDLPLTAKWQENAAHEHSWGDWKETTPAACGKAGEKTRQCQICQKTETEELPATGAHDWNGGEITRQPTCTQPGERTFTCKNCPATRTEPISVTDHNWDEGKVTREPTVTEAGEKIFTCQDCHATKTESIPATGVCSHEWGEWEETTPPTCTQAGQKTRQCQKCKAIEKEEIPATDHNWDEGKVTREPTATQAGEKIFTCQDCQTTKTEPIPATGACSHEWDAGKVTKEATCIQPGEKTFICQKCQATKIEAIPATGEHTWNGGEITTAPTCVQPGERTFTCHNCPATRKEAISATGVHRWNAGQVTKAPTATEAGVKTYTCQDCQTTKTEPIPATGACSHDWDAGAVTREPTCAQPGERTFTCRKCQTTKKEAIPATEAHVWNEGEIVKEPTCGQPGKRTYTCQNCEETKREEIEATGEHVWADGKITTEPTCTEDGQKTVRCKNCEATDTEAIPAAGHEWDKGKVTVKATCQKAGIRTFRCQVCKETRTEKIPSDGAHRFGKYETVKRASVMSKGLKIRKCAVCKKTESASIPKLVPTLKLNAKNIVLRTGQTTKKVKVSALAYGDKVKSWRSSDKKVVKVTRSGEITAQKKTGRAVLTVTLKSGKEAAVKVRVQKGEVKTAKISGLPKKATLKAGKKFALKPLVMPITSVQKVTYSISDKKVAAVNKKGVITAKKAGKAKITVKSGKRKYQITLTVKK